METLSFLVGLALLIAVSLDFIFTTIGAQERAILSLRITRAIFRSLRRTSPAHRARWPHRISGPLVMSGLAAFWLFGVSLGWTLVTAAYPGAIAPETDWPDPGWWDVYAHIGHLLSTLGAGVTRPATTFWYLIGAIVAVNGMVILTLAVSFTLSTTQTVARGRAFAALAGILDPADPDCFDLLGPSLADLCSSLKSAPFALFYSAGDPELRLPAALHRFAVRAAEGPDLARYRRLLKMLPDFDPPRGASDDEYLESLADWVRGYTLEL